MRTLVLIVSLSLLAACSSLSRDECLTADWETIGFEDGANGQPRQRIGEHRKACASHGITPDREAYDAGYAEGIATFCTFDRGEQAGRSGQQPMAVCSGMADYAEGHRRGVRSYCSFDTGFEEGISGNAYDRVCPANLEAEFLVGFDEGRYIYDLRSVQSELERELENNKQAASKAEARIEEILDAVAQDDSLTREQRTTMLRESEQLREELQDLVEARAELVLELDDVEDELEALGYL